MSGDPTAAAAPPAGRRDLLIDLLWLLLLMAWAAGWCLTAADRLGPTYDEPFYLQAGLSDWRDGVPKQTSAHGVMPLPVEVATYPLYRFEQQTGKRIDTGDPERLPEHLGAARRMTLVWVALLLVSALRLGRAAGGPWAGRVAAGLVAADPNFLAHGSLATTDLAVAASLLAFTRAAYAGRGGGWRRRILLPGIWYGVAVLCKLSALLYGGIILVALEVAHRISSGALARPAGASRGAWLGRVVGAALRSGLAVAAVVAIGIGLALWYCGDPPPDARPMAEMLQKIPDRERLKPLYAELAEKYERPPYAAVTFAFQWWHNSEGRPAFLNGTYYPAGCWFYFPVLLAMKIPLPVVVLALAALARPRTLLNPLSLAALLLLATTPMMRLQTGVRLVLPIMAIGYAALAVSVCRGFGRWGVGAGLLAVAVMAGTSAWVWPHGLGYLNQLAGGPAAAHERVSDSNIDWGQGVPDLIAWHKAHGEPPMAVWYFGTDPAAAKPPFEQLFVEHSRIATANEFRAAVKPRLLAVGATVLTLHPFDPPPKAAAMRYLMTLEPIARTATFVIYDFRNSPEPPPGM
jgi:hypothetical protein